jgi:hypothetical protein
MALFPPPQAFTAASRWSIPPKTRHWDSRAINAAHTPTFFHHSDHFIPSQFLLEYTHSASPPGARRP